MHRIHTPPHLALKRLCVELPRWMVDHIDAELGVPGNAAGKFDSRSGFIYDLVLSRGVLPAPTITLPAFVIQQEQFCDWQYANNPLFDDIPGTYESACGRMWSFSEGHVQDTDVTYCRGCGKPIKEVIE